MADVSTPPIPQHAVPPSVRSRRSAQFSEEERGGRSYCSTGGRSFASSFDDSGSPLAQSPMPTKRLFDEGGSARPAGRGGGRMPALAFGFLLLVAVWSWAPVVRWALGGDGSPSPSDREEDESVAHVHVFHEPSCAGESITVRRDADLCGLSYKSGDAVKDNVASVLVSGRLAVAVYATCKLAEQPANPMLLETLSTEGCSELRYPLAGHLALRPAGSSERGDGGAAAHGEEAEL